ncbi:MAG: cytochrome c [Hyphomicrobium sp.]
MMRPALTYKSNPCAKHPFKQVAGALALVLMCVGSSAWAGGKAQGEALLTKNCARCHAIGATGESALDKAPPFRQVVTRYPLDNLAESLAEGIVSGHADMPEFVFQPDEIDAILAYLETLKADTSSGQGQTGDGKQNSP